jgi:hypothetical protein
MNETQIDTKHSKRYEELINMYKHMHTYGEEKLNLPPEKTFNGISIQKYIQHIRDLTIRTNSKTLLDYGCGKANLWTKVSHINIDDKKYPIKDFFQLDSISLYDPAYEPYSKMPTGKFDCVVCIDVLEHIAKEDIPWTVQNLFDFSDKSLLANIACYPAIKTLPNGENAHCTIENTQWWKSIFSKVANDNIKWKVYLEYIEDNVIKTDTFGNY